MTPRWTVEEFVRVKQALVPFYKLAPLYFFLERMSVVYRWCVAESDLRDKSMAPSQPMKRVLS